MTNNLQRRPAGRVAWVGAVCALGLMLGASQAKAQPGNDNFDSAATISGASGSIDGTLAGATPDVGQPSYHGVGARSVWYAWTAPTNGQATFDTSLRSLDAVVTVYTGNALVNLAPVPSPNTPVSSCASFNANAGVVYQIMVSGGSDTDFSLTWSMPAATSGVFAGQFRFSASTYFASEYESFGAPFGPPGPNAALWERSAEGAVIAVSRVGGSAGRVMVDYRTMDEVPTLLTATVITEVTGVVQGTNAGVVFYTNQARITRYFTNAYDRSSSSFFTDNFTTNIVASSNLCDMAATCSMTNVVFNCSPDFLFRYGCPGADYFSTSGTLVFDEFETTKRFLVPVFSDAGGPFSRNGNKDVRLELFNPRLADDELFNPTDMVPPIRDSVGSAATLRILEVFPFNGGTNFSIERVSYAVNESAGSITIDILHPSGSGGNFIVHVEGSEEEPRYVPSPGSDYATELVRPFFRDPVYTDGTTNFLSSQDFVAFTTNVTVAAGTRRARITIPILDDNEVEFNEDIHVRLEQVNQQPPIGPITEALVTILDNDQPAGALDRDWNPDNVSFSTPRFNLTPGADGIVRGAAVQADQRTIIVGDFTSYNAEPCGYIARINTNGSYDVSFSPGSGADNFISSVAIYPVRGTANDRKIVIGGGFTAFDGQGRYGVARLNANGSPDSSFNVGTGVSRGGGLEHATVWSVAVQSDGKVLIAGDFTEVNGTARNGLARLNANGSLDATFNPGAGADGTVLSVAVRDSQQNIFVPRAAEGTELEDVNEIETGANQGIITVDYDFLSIIDNIRVYYDGARIFDLTTNGVGRLTIPFGPGNSTRVTIILNEGTGEPGTLWRYIANVSVPVTERKIFIGGEFLYYNGAFRGHVARLNDNGTLDANYEPGGGADGTVYTVVPQPDGRLLVGGSFPSFDFQPRGNLARLENSGALDLSYDPGSGANDAVYAIALQPDGKALVGGVFTSFNGTRRLGLTRLFANGTVDTSFLDTAYNHFAGLINTFHFEPPNYVNAIALQTNGGVMIGGSFSTLGGNYALNYTDLTPWVLPFDNTFAGVPTQVFGWQRADKHPRYNVARLIGGYTPGPGNIEFILGRNNVNENAGTLSVPFRRLDGRLGTVEATASTSDNLATNGVDFIGGSGLVFWPEDDFIDEPIGVGYVGENYYSIPIVDDQNIEGDELFGLALRDPVGSINLGDPFGGGGVEVIPLGAALGRSSSTADIIEDDRSKGVLAFSSATFFTNESFNLKVTVIRTNGADGAITVQYFTRDWTNAVNAATAGQDYAPIALGRLNFGPNVTSQTITITNIPDNFVEADENFIITLTNASPGASLFNGSNSISVTATIIDDDVTSGHPSFAVPYAYSTNESAGFAQIPVVRLGGSQGQLSVSVIATAGTATAGSDFTPVTNTLTWAHLDVSPKILFVPITSDSAVETAKTINLRLTNQSPSTATGGVNTATMTILDDDLPGQISFSQAFYDADERGTNITVTVIRSGGVGGNVTVQYYLVDGTAVNGLDFISAATSSSPGFFTFGPGVTATNFSITILDNGLMDSNRLATLILTSFSPTNANGPITNATLRIFDDESIGDPAGSLDTTFSPGAGGTNAIHSLILQPDNKLLIAGEFRTLNRILRNRVGRLNADGTLDQSFNPLGGPNGAVRAMALQPDDGRVVIGGFFDKVHGTNRNHIARLLQDGTLDRFFNPGSGADNPVYALGLLPDRRIVIGGSFTTVNGISRAGIAVLETNGMVSAPFNPGTGVDGTVFAIAVQPDGKLLLGGDFTTVNGSSHPRVARLNQDGSVDATFDAGIGPSSTVRAITLQPDGKILIGGSFTSVNGTDRGRLARLDSSGALDSVFLGAVEGANADVTSIAIQFDGNIVVLGEFTTFNGVSRNRITRLYRNGKTDPTINFGDGANDTINTAVIQPDRKVIIGGRFTAYDGQPRFFLARIHGGSIAGPGTIQFSSPRYEIAENGGSAVITVQRRGGTTSDVTVDYQTLEESATAGVDYTDVSGTLTFLEGETRRTFTVPIINDLVGETNETVSLVLTNQTGGTTLGDVPSATLTIISDDSGVGFSSASYTVNEGVVGGAMLISVVRTGATNGTATVNYTTTSGTATAGQDFSTRSGVLTFAPGETMQTFSVPITDDQLIESSETFNLLLSNLTGGGALSVPTATVTIVDNDFQTGSLTFAAAAYSVAESGGSVTVTVLRTNGSTGVITVDYATVPGTALAGNDYTAKSGTLTFAEGQTNQTIVITILDDASVEGDEDFSIQLSNPGGGTTITGPSSVMVTIVDEEFGPGSVDRTFDPGAGANGLVRSVAVQTNGMVLIGGAFTAFDGVARNYVARLNPTGSHDLGFDPGSGPDAFVASVSALAGNRALVAGSFNHVNGINYNRVALLLSDGTPDGNYRPSTEMNSAIYTMAVQPDGRALMGGAFARPTRGIIRLALDGSVDSSFILGSGADGAVHAIAVQTDGSVVIGGNFLTVNGGAHLRVARLTRDGFEDTAFVSGAITSGTVFSLAIQTDGKIIVGGDFKTAAGTNRVNIARLNSDGSLDTGFAAGLGANSTVYALGFQSDGHIVVAGDFTTINGTNRNRFARLNADGSLDASFDPGRGANNTVYSLVVLPDDNLLLGGEFTLVGGVPRRGVARILASNVAPSAFSSVSAAGGQLQLSLAVRIGVRYVLEASADLRNWSPVATNVAASPTWHFTQPNLNSYATRFFRVREARP